MNTFSTAGKRFTLLIASFVLTAGQVFSPAANATPDSGESLRSKKMADEIAKCDLKSPSLQPRFNRLAAWWRTHHSPADKAAMDLAGKQIKEGKAVDPEMASLSIDTFSIARSGYSCLFDVLKNEIPEQINVPFEKAKKNKGFDIKMVQYLNELNARAEKVAPTLQKFFSRCTKNDELIKEEEYKKKKCDQMEESVLRDALQLLTINAAFERNRKFVNGENQKSISELNEAVMGKFDTLIKTASKNQPNSSGKPAQKSSKGHTAA